jgi:hypothetical protein
MKYLEVTLEIIKTCILQEKKGIIKANKINPFQSKENRINLLLRTFYEK